MLIKLMSCKSNSSKKTINAKTTSILAESFQYSENSQNMYKTICDWKS